MLPSLTRLRAPTGTYPDGEVEWTDRADLVVGGCKPGSAEETKCYDDWSKAFLERILENRMANAIVLLSVGAGVNELRTIKRVERGKMRPIKYIWLIDPLLDRDTGDQVASMYAAHLEGADVTYFTGDGAYDDAANLSRFPGPS